MRVIKHPVLKPQGSKTRYSLKEQIKNFVRALYKLVTFVILLTLYLVGKAVDRITRSRFFPNRLRKRLHQIMINIDTYATRLLDPHKRWTGSILRLELIDLSMKNLMSRKTRTMVTVGGMTIGIAIIVFLVSIGYGLQRLVIGRVARLEELQQIDVTPQAGGKVKINSETISAFRNITEVNAALPLIAVVGRVSYENSVSDMAVYGVTTAYLDQSAIKPTSGKIFESDTDILGVSSLGSQSLTENTDTPLEMIELEPNKNTSNEQQVETRELSPDAMKQAVVNQTVLKILGIKEDEGIGKKFSVVFVVVGNLLDDPSIKIESISAEYTIVGVIPMEETPVFYVPFSDLESLGIVNFSQVKVVVDSQDNLTKVRRQLEAMGYVTTSVVDTVAQISSLFATARTILALFGILALSIASLGMFNTLTVSLLERTREVGLMKAMGMKSTEVYELFLTESMIMGVFGGILGLALGYFIGKLLSLGLSIFAIVRGAESINISYVPLSFSIIILLFSFIIGVITGIYPARRAKKISALNALRYE